MAIKFIQSNMKLKNIAKLINGEFKNDITYIGWRIPPYQDTERLMFDMWGGSFSMVMSRDQHTINLIKMPNTPGKSFTSTIERIVANPQRLIHWIVKNYEPPRVETLGEVLDLYRKQTNLQVIYKGKYHDVPLRVLKEMRKRYEK